MPVGEFASPAWFGMLVVVAALAVGYLAAQRRRRQHTLRFANLELLDRIAQIGRAHV